MALTPEEQAELNSLKQQYIALKQPSQEETTFFDRVSRGKDMLDVTAGRAIEASGEIFGLEGLRQSGQNMAERNQLEADLTAPPIRDISEDAFGFLGDALTEGLPSIGALGAGAASGAAIGSVFPVVGTGVGALAGLGLTAFGLNLGTAKEIESAIDPDSEADVGTLLTAGVATIPDILTGGALSQSAKTALKDATKKTIAKQVAKDTGIGVGAAVASQAALDVGSTLSTDAGFDEDRVESISDNTAQAAILGSVATPLLSAGAQTAGRSVALREEAMERNSSFRVEDDGSVSYIEPNPEALRSTDALKKAITSIGMGRSVDELIMSQPDNLTLRSAAAEFDTTFDERVRTQGKNTINVESQLKKGEWLQKANQFELNKLSSAERKQVKADLLAGKSTPLADAVRGMFKDVRNSARASGIRMGDLGKTYFPFIADVKKIRENRTAFIDEMVDSAKGKVKDLTKFREEVSQYAARVTEQGSDLPLGDSIPVPKEILDIYDEFVEKGGSQGVTDELKAKLSKPIRSLEEKGTVNRNNSLEQHRKLSAVDPAVLDKWAKDIDILEVLDMYTQSSAERISYAERFGANNEKLHGLARLAQLEGLEKGKPVNPAAIEKLYNIADLQQRVTAKRVSPEYRDRVRTIKTIMNYKTLPLATLSSIVEPLFLAPKVGTKPFIKGGMKAVETSARKLARTFLKNIPESEFEKALQGMNTGFREALGTLSARHGEDLGQFTPTKADQLLFKYNLLAPWTEFTRIWAQGSALEAFKQDARLLNDLSQSKGARAQAAQRLGEAGTDPNKALQWEARGSRQDDPLFREMQAGAINVAEDVIFKPDAVRKPTWINSPHWFPQLFGQLKTFPITFTNRLAVPVLNKLRQVQGAQSPEMYLRTLITMSLATVGFIMQDAMKSAIREGNLDKWEDKTPEERIANAAMQLGGTSLFVDPFAAEASGGSALETVAGPALGSATGVVEQTARVMIGNVTPEEYVNNLMAELLPNIPASGAIREELRN